MMTAIRGLLVAALLLSSGAACTPRSTLGGPGSRPDLITFEEMQQRGQHSNLYDLIQDLRPRWLRSQGPDTFMGEQGQVQVHMDGNLLGPVGILRRMSAYGVTSIQWLAPIDASARYGVNHSHGAIVISTAPVH